MSLILVWGARTPIVRVARMAGQYAKPRSSPTEVIDGKKYSSFRGDNVNGIGLHERNPDPQRLLSAYFHSAATLNYVRTLINSQFADLHHPEQWNLDHVQNQGLKEGYSAIVKQLLDTFSFMQTIGAGTTDSAFKSVELFMSHEGLLLEYEQRLTRLYNNKFYNLGSHFLWIGDRTRQLTGAHIEYFRGIQNPIGVKVGPTMKSEEIAPLLDILNPNKEVGKITLISRYGAGKIRKFLPAHIKAVQATKHKVLLFNAEVVWCCDPMHGNTETTASGIKTRRFENVMQELVEAFQIHIECNSKLGGVHLELTGDAVTETIGGSMNLKEDDLKLNYQTHCDPRLNYEQSMDVAFKIADYFRKKEYMY